MKLDDFKAHAERMAEKAGHKGNVHFELGVLLAMCEQMFDALSPEEQDRRRRYCDLPPLDRETQA